MIRVMLMDRGNLEFKRLLLDRGVGPKSLWSRCTGISLSTINRHVSGERVPNIDQREQYARALGVSIDEIHEAFAGMGQIVGSD